jgi:hypothetical protein
MRRLAQAPNILIAQLWIDMLRDQGFETTLQRYFISSIAGDVPPDQCAPELWVTDESLYDKALLALRQLQNTPQRRWVCLGCAELVEGGFVQCWNCGLEEGAAPAPVLTPSP